MRLLSDSDSDRDQTLSGLLRSRILCGDFARHWHIELRKGKPP